MKDRFVCVKTTGFVSWVTGDYEFWGVFVCGEKRFTVYLGKLS